MRPVMRFSPAVFWSVWARGVARSVSAGVRFWPFAARALIAAARARRVVLGVLVGFPVTVGWPLLFWLVQKRPGYHRWLQGIAIPWWIIVGAAALVLLAARFSQEELPAGGCAAGCHCDVCASGDVFPS